jgi:hypothetical protein
VLGGALLGYLLARILYTVYNFLYQQIITYQTKNKKE